MNTSLRRPARPITDECSLHPGAGPTTLHTHSTPEIVCVIEGSLRVLGVYQGKAYQARVPAGKNLVIPAHVPHVVINTGTTIVRFFAIRSVPDAEMHLSPGPLPRERGEHPLGSRACE